MTYNFCLVPWNEVKKGTTLGRDWAEAHRDEWISREPDSYLGAGYVKGVDNVVFGGKAYAIQKTYIYLEEDMIMFLCTESIAACDVTIVPEEPKSESEETEQDGKEE
jgi:hypothetical protein